MSMTQIRLASLTCYFFIVAEVYITEAVISLVGAILTFLRVTRKKYNIGYCQ